MTQRETELSGGVATPGNTGRQRLAISNQPTASPDDCQDARGWLESDVEAHRRYRNPENQKGVARVEIALPELLYLKRVRLVDTPGLGSIHEHNSQSTRAWLPRIGVALLVISCDQPFAADDARLLAEIRPHTPKLAVILTKADLLEPAQLAEVAEFVRAQAQAQWGKSAAIYPYSLRRSAEVYRRTVLSDLLLSLAAAGNASAAEIAAHKLRSLTAAARHYLEVALEAARASDSARARLREDLAKERSQLPAVRREIYLLASDLKSRARTLAEERFLAERPSLLSALRAALQTQLPQWRGNLAQVVEQFEAWLQAALVAELERRQDIGQEVAKINQEEAAAAFQRTVGAFQARLAQSVERALQLPFRGMIFTPAPPPRVRPRLWVGRIFDSQIQTLWFLIPMRIFKPLVDRHLMRQLPWEAEKHLYRSAAQWSEVCDKAIDDFARQASDFIKGEITSLESMLASPNCAADRIAATLARLAR
ncbi:MAG: dynamin family protein [Planctomycetota bacterium]|nr:dynamin family protein [Planctomycetota bacterium]